MLHVLEHRRNTFSSGEIAVMTIDDLLASSKSIRPASRDAALSYMRRRSDLTAHVNVFMECLPSIHKLTGGNRYVRLNDTSSANR
jgi:hypothetical protein